MDIPVKVVVVIILALLVVLGIMGTATLVFDQGGKDLDREGSDVIDDLDCVLSNKDEPREHCPDNSNFELSEEKVVLNA